jgi:hypothetical protein
MSAQNEIWVPSIKRAITAVEKGVFCFGTVLVRGSYSSPPYVKLVPLQGEGNMQIDLRPNAPFGPCVIGWIEEDWIRETLSKNEADELRQFFHAHFG